MATQEMEREVVRQAPKLRVRQRLAALVAAAVIGGALGTAPVGPTVDVAHAAAPIMTSSGAWRECTKTTLTGCGSRGTLAKGTTLKMHCWIDDSWATGEYRSNRWFYVTASNGIRGFVHSSRVGSQASVGNCKNHNGVAPARWAAMQVGEKAPSSSEASALGIYDGMWSGWCQAFAGGSHKLTGYKALSGYASAAATYREYNARGLVKKTSITNSGISIGSLVYYSTSLAGGFGHVAVYVGNGYVITTQGVNDPKLPVARKPLKTWGTPIGWVPPAWVDGKK